MFFGTLWASLLENILSGKGIVRAGAAKKNGKGIVRAGCGNEKGKENIRANYGKEYNF